ncbi:MAG: M20/M25/M40 family metallo-hydrolase [Clostridia bacterium]|nr:M20/M25/M40 family metallo-hydrolase [Clostridia bacterium]
MTTIELLKKLTSPAGVAGEESSSFEALKGLFSLYGDVSCDDAGNIIIHRDGKGKHILLDAHLDTIGFIVTGITDDGFIRVQKVGGVDMRTVEGMELTLHGERDIYGVVCTVPPHLSDGENKVSTDGTAVVDIGMNKEDAEKVISIGDRASFKSSFSVLNENRVSSPYVDDRGGIAVLLKALEYTKTENEITLVCSAQEETGGTGATCASFNVQADLSVSVDVSFATTPDSKESECGKMNGGAMIGYAPILDRAYTEMLVAIAKEKEIPYQKEIMNGRTGTNADHITISKGGIPSVLVSLPLRYMHTPVETVDVRDIESCAKLIAEFLERV